MSEADRDLNGCNILIVEDQYFIASDISNTLKIHGANIVGPVANLEQGLVLAREQKLDCAVLDINLCGRMSFAIADILKQRDIPFIFATGYEEWSLPTDRRDILRIDKPFDSRAIVAALRDLVKRTAPPLGIR